MELTIENVEKIISEEINPSLAEHAGFIQLVALEDNRVIISFHAGCAGCPSSRGRTLESIKRYMIEAFDMSELIVENAEFAE